jgi:hypothetical protein
VIIGRLIPAGTGTTVYQGITYEDTQPAGNGETAMVGIEEEAETGVLGD